MVKEKKMPPTPSGSVSIDQGAGPFNYGDTLTFTVETDNMRGGYPMVAVYLFQEEEVVWLTLNTPEQSTIVLGSGGSQLDATQPSDGLVRLLRYDWKGKQETVTELDAVEFDAGP